MSALHLALLGPPQLRYDQQVVSLKAAKALALLAYLAVKGEPQQREHLVDLLWPMSRPDAGRQNLSNRLWSIRKTFGNGIVRADSQHLALSDAVWTDVKLLEVTLQNGSNGATLLDDQQLNQIQSATDLWRGPFLDGIRVVDAPDFELWLTNERTRLEQLYLKGVTKLIHRQRAVSNWSAVIETAQAALQVDRLQEPIIRTLMEAHARCGQRTKALRLYDSFHTALDAELGVEPLPDTDELRAAILNGIIKAEPPRPTHSTEGTTQWTTLSQPAATPFVGRKAEHAFLTNALKRAATGQAQIVLITGELGIGKSRLWQTWSNAVSNQLDLHQTHCLDTTQSLPLTPLTTLLQRPTTLDILLHPDASISPIWLTELSRLLPEIRHRQPQLPMPIPMPLGEERRRLFEASIQALRSLVLDHPLLSEQTLSTEETREPLVLFVDDLHWADPSTIDWLVYLTDRLQDEPFLLIGTYRPREAAPRLAQVFRQWQRTGVAEELPLIGLTEDEVNQLIKALGGDVVRSTELQEQSAGNPYFLIELARAEKGKTPQGLAELIKARLQQFSPIAQQVLQVTAIQGNAIEYALLQRINQFSSDEILTALDNLLDTGVFIEDGNTFTFSHLFIATIIREEMSSARRTHLHLQAAHTLEAIHANQLLPVAGQLVAHYQAASQPASAAHYADRAADHAQNLGALVEAIAFRRLALASEQTTNRKMNLGYCLLFDDQYLTEVRGLFQAGLAEYEEANDTKGVAKACLALGASYILDVQGAEVLHWTERALAYLSDPTFSAIEDPAMEADVNRQLGAGAMLLGLSAADVEAYFGKALDLAREHDLFSIGVDSLFGLGNFCIQRAEYHKAKAAFEEAIELAKTNSVFFLEAITYNNLAHCLCLMGRLTDASASVEKGERLAKTYAISSLYQYFYSTRGEIALAENALDRADGWFQQSMTKAQKYHNQAHIENIRANRGLVAQRRGDLDQALNYLKEAWEGIGDKTDLFTQTKVGLQLADLYLQRGEKSATKKIIATVECYPINREWVGLHSWIDRLKAELT